MITETKKMTGEKIAPVFNLNQYRRKIKMRTTIITAADIISQIEGKVNEKLIPILREADERGEEIPDATIEGLRNVYTAGYGKAFLTFYEDQGARIHGKRTIHAIVDLAKQEVESRRITLDDLTDVSMPQLADRRFENYVEAEHGISINIPGTQYTQEDFRFGVAPYGYRPTENKLGLDPEKALDEVRKGYDPLERPLEEILATLPRTYRLEHQTYQLDVEATLQESSISPHIARYRELKSALTNERDDPAKQDQLRKLYAQAELDKLPKVVGTSYEVDDE